MKKIIDFNKLPESRIRECYSKFRNNAHLKRSYSPKDLVIVVGEKKKSKLLDKAIQISESRLDKIGRPYQAVSKKMEKTLGISGSIQRSIPPRYIHSDHIKKLKKILSLN